MSIVEKPELFCGSLYISELLWYIINVSGEGLHLVEMLQNL